MAEIIEILDLKLRVSNLDDADKLRNIQGQIADEIKRSRDENKKLRREAANAAKIEGATQEDVIRIRRQKGRIIADNTNKIRDLRRQQRQANNAIDALDASSGAYDRLRFRVNTLSRVMKDFETEGKKAPKEIAEEFERLNEKIRQVDASVGDYRRNVGNYKDAFVQALSEISKVEVGSNIIQSALGLDGLSGQIFDFSTSFGASGLAIGTVVAGGVKLAETLVEVNEEFDKLRAQVQSTTRLSGEALSDLTVRTATTAQVFDQDVNEVLKATNSLINEFPVSYNQANKALNLLAVGNRAAFGDDIQSIQEYATQIREAGGSIEDLVKILIVSAQEGIFSDKGIDAIREGAKQLRDQSKSVQTALTNAFGESFTNDLLEQIRERDITSLEGLQRISAQVKVTGLNAQELQQLTSTLFSGAGEDAGRFLDVIDGIDKELSELIDITDEYNKRQLINIEATNRLNTEYEELSRQVTGNTSDFALFAKNFRTVVLQDVNKLIRGIRVLSLNIQALFRDGFNADFTSIEKLREQDAALAEEEARREVVRKQVDEDRQRRIKLFTSESTESLNRLRESSELVNLDNFDSESVARAKENIKLIDDILLARKESPVVPISSNVNLEKATDEAKQLIEGSTDFFRDRIKELQDELGQAATPDLFADISRQIKDTEAQLKQLVDEAAIIQERARREADGVQPVRSIQEIRTELEGDNVTDDIREQTGGGITIPVRLESTSEVSSDIDDLVRSRSENTKRIIEEELQSIDFDFNNGNEIVGVDDIEKVKQLRAELTALSSELSIAISSDASAEEIQAIQIRAQAQIDSINRVTQAEQAAAERRTQIADELGSGIGDAFGQLFSDQEDANEEFQRAILQTSLQALRASLEPLIAQSIGKLVAINPLAGFLGAAAIRAVFNGLFAGASNAINSFHTGGVIGEKNRSTHNVSLKKGEVPIIAKKGEGVINAHAMSDDKVYHYSGTKAQIAAHLNDSVGELGFPSGGEQHRFAGFDIPTPSPELQLKITQVAALNRFDFSRVLRPQPLAFVNRDGRMVRTDEIPQNRNIDTALLEKSVGDAIKKSDIAGKVSQAIKQGMQEVELHSEINIKDAHSALNKYKKHLKNKKSL